MGGIMNPSLNAALSVMENHWRDIKNGRYGTPELLDEDALIRIGAMGSEAIELIGRASHQYAVMNGKPSYTVSTGEALRERLRLNAQRDRN